jgi:hypothetical protein
MLSWCEANAVGYVIGLPKNGRLQRRLKRRMKLARAQCTTIRPRLLKIGARMRITARKVWISLASGYAWAEIFEQVYENLEGGAAKRLKTA